MLAWREKRNKIKMLKEQREEATKEREEGLHAVGGALRGFGVVLVAYAVVGRDLHGGWRL